MANQENAVTDGPELSAARNQLLATLRDHIDQNGLSAVNRMVDQLLAVPERPMRAHLLAERLPRYDTHLCLLLLRTILNRSAMRDPRAREVLLDLTRARPIARLLGYQRSRQLYELAHQRDQGAVAQLFLSTLTESSQNVSPEFLARENTKLPDESLGWRKRLARGNDRLKLDRLLFDRNPTVIAMLLKNPRLIERDVVKIAAMRPTNPACLLEVFQSEKWIKRYRVKVALACNPYSPLDIAMACVPHLMLPRLQYLARNRTVHQRVRETAEDLIRRRHEGFSDEQDPIHLVGSSGTIVREIDGGEMELELDFEQITRELEDWMAV